MTLNAVEFRDRLTLFDKWNKITKLMDDIAAAETAFSMRRRLNPHHPKEQAREEARKFREMQYEKWCATKDFYAEHRDELSNTLDSEVYRNYRDILERIFTNELDEALRKTLGE